MDKRQFCFILVELQCFISGIQSIGKDNKGMEFIFGFMDNERPFFTEVFITTYYRSTVTINITTPKYDTNFFKSVSISYGQVRKISFDSKISGTGIELGNKGIHVKASQEITLYAVNKAEATTDAFLVFPIDALGKNYYVLSWKTKSEFMVVAIEDHTNVKIKISNEGASIKYNGITYTAGMTLTLHLEKYETFHAYDELADFSGTCIESDKDITVMSGNKCIDIGNGACDHLVSQMTTIEAIGKQFVTINMPNCASSVNYRILATEKNTKINIAGVVVATLSNIGDIYTFRIADKSSKFISTDKPTYVAMFTEGGCGSTSGDPAMVLIPPVPQYAADYTFATIDVPLNPFHNSLTVVIPDKDITGLILDGHNISNIYWRNVQGSPTLKVRDFPVSDGAHTIYHLDPTVTFLAVSSGLARYNSYGYAAGQRLAPINSNCSTSKPKPGDIVDNDCDGTIDEEIKDGKDNDGDGLIDEDTAAFFSLGECQSDPCKNGGLCSDLTNGYNCTCDSGFTGVNCEIDIDECQSDPCQHDATCTDQVNGYNCTCVSGYSGVYCEIDINECLSTPCLHGGKCLDLINAYKCHCLDGYTDAQCQTDIDECQSDPCQHGATCTDQINGYNCTCVSGYDGINCEIDIDECQSDPCQHDATCTDQINGYNCTCVSGYSGVHCEIDINECLSTPCLHGGKCLDLINVYKCHCLDGYTDTQCQTDIDECHSDPCQHGATCTDQINGYNCTCVSGYDGSNCEIDINECQSTQCFNNGTCIDGIASCSCACIPGFTGVQCQTDIDECSSSPCFNNGSCINRINYYECVCAHDTMGDNCQLRLDHCKSSPCLNEGICRNHYDNFTCECNYPWHGDICEYKTINRTQMCTDLEYTKCSCFTTRLKIPEVKSYKIISGLVGILIGLIGTIILYALWNYLKHNAFPDNNALQVKEYKPSAKSDNNEQNRTGEKIEEDKEEWIGPEHCDCFVDHTGYDHFKRYDAKNNRFRFNNCRHKRQALMPMKNKVSSC